MDPSELRAGVTQAVVPPDPDRDAPDPVASVEEPATTPRSGCSIGGPGRDIGPHSVGRYVTVGRPDPETVRDLAHPSPAVQVLDVGVPTDRGDLDVPRGGDFSIATGMVDGNPASAGDDMDFGRFVEPDIPCLVLDPGVGEPPIGAQIGEPSLEDEPRRFGSSMVTSTEPLLDLGTFTMRVLPARSMRACCAASTSTSRGIGRIDNDRGVGALAGNEVGSPRGRSISAKIGSGVWKDLMSAHPTRVPVTTGWALSAWGDWPCP